MDKTVGFNRALSRRSLIAKRRDPPFVESPPRHGAPRPVPRASVRIYEVAGDQPSEAPSAMIDLNSDETSDPPSDEIAPHL
jgi:hypothetical protein